MRFGGLGQLWSTLIKLLSLMFLCQLVSPLVALLAIVVSGTETPDTTWSQDLVSDITQSSLAVDNLAIDSELQTLITSENTISGIVEKQSSYQDLKYSASDLPEYSSFAIKIVMKGVDPSYVPKVQDIRAVAAF